MKNSQPVAIITKLYRKERKPFWFGDHERVKFHLIIKEEKGSIGDSAKIVRVDWSRETQFFLALISLILNLILFQFCRNDICTYMFGGAVCFHGFFRYQLKVEMNFSGCIS